MKGYDGNACTHVYRYHVIPRCRFRVSSRRYYSKELGVELVVAMLVVERGQTYCRLFNVLRKKWFVAEQFERSHRESLRHWTGVYPIVESFTTMTHDLGFGTINYCDSQHQYQYTDLNPNRGGSSSKNMIPRKYCSAKYR